MKESLHVLNDLESAILQLEGPERNKLEEEFDLLMIELDKQSE